MVTDYWGRLPAMKPEDVAGYRDQLLYTMKKDTQFCAANMGGVIVNPDSGIVMGLVKQIRAAELILWNSHQFLSASAGHEAFVGKVFNWPESLNQFWILSDDISLRSEDAKAFGFVDEMIFGELWMSVDNGKVYLAQFMHKVFTSAPKDMMDAAMPRILFGVWSVDEPIDDKLAPVVAEYAFMNSPLIAEPKVFAWPRGFRRRAQKANEILPEVKVVTLRRKIYDSKSETKTDRHLHHQFVVSGHWRQQYYPSKEENRPKWIESYLKGPEGAPLLPVRDTVYKVTR